MKPAWSPLFVWGERCRRRGRYRPEKLGDRKAKRSPTKWHSEPCGFEIIGYDRIKTKGWGALFSYTDALRTVHLTGCESVTVSSCLADNMAKGIHLNGRTTTERRLVREMQGKGGRAASRAGRRVGVPDLHSPGRGILPRRGPAGGGRPLYLPNPFSFLSSVSKTVTRSKAPGIPTTETNPQHCRRWQGTGDGVKDPSPIGTILLRFSSAGCLRKSRLYLQGDWAADSQRERYVTDTVLARTQVMASCKVPRPV